MGLDRAAYSKAGKASSKANLKRAVNIFDPKDSDVYYGGYPLYTTGAILNNVAFNTTGYIPILENTTYVRQYLPLNTTTTYWGINQGQIAYYDQNKVYISGDAGTAYTLTTPPGAYFVRLAVPIAYWWDFQLYQASAIGASTWYVNNNQIPNEYREEFQLYKLRKTRYKVMNLISGANSERLVISLIGDSYLQIASKTTTQLANYLVAKLGDGGGGWVGFGYLSSSAGTAPWTSVNQPSNLNGNARPTLYPCRVYGSPTATYYTANTADCASLSLLTSGDAVEVDFPATPVISAIKLHYVATASGSIRYTLNGGTNWTTLSVSGTAGTTTVATLSLTGLTQPGTLRIEWVSGTGTLSGVDLQSTAKGVVLHKIAATGGSLSGWAGLDGTNWQTSFSALSSDLTVIQDGRNSQAAAVLAATRQSALREVIQRARGKTTTSSTTENTAMDILIYTSPENSAPGSTVAIAQYAMADRVTAVTHRAAHIDGQCSMGEESLPSEYAYNGVVPLMSNDNSGSGSIHLQALTGGAIMAGQLARAILWVN